MRPIQFSARQEEILSRPAVGRLFIEGPAGCGKTTCGVERMLALIRRGEQADAILVLVPQLTLAEPYREGLRRADLPPGGETDVITAGGLARRMLDLYWPLVAAPAGFAQPDQPPVFLTLETAQYYMAHLVRPLVEEQGYFESISIDRNRLYSQILDNLNKAAVVNFPHQEIGARLASAWLGDPSQQRVYAQAQECATRFRSFCLEHNLLDYSLQMDVFTNILWKIPEFRASLRRHYTHLIADNLEEDTPAAHDMLMDWLPDFSSALLIADQEAGYRRFLGADPDDVERLKSACQDVALLDDSFVCSPGIELFGRELKSSLGGNRNAQPAPGPGSKESGLSGSLEYSTSRFHSEMVGWVAAEVKQLVEKQGVPPEEIVILAPYLSDALRFSIMRQMEAQAIPIRSHRPSRGLRDEPATQCLLTLAALAHPGWNISPNPESIARALMQTVDGLDLVRAHLLSQVVYRQKDGQPHLNSFDEIKETEMQERITFLFGQRYQTLRAWIMSYRAGPALELDYFISRLFGEVLSQPGFGFHRQIDAGEVTATLIESIRKFRWEVGPYLGQSGTQLGREYVQMVQEGVVAAQYLPKWRAQPEQAVLVAPAYTFLMSNRPVGYQFWLDIGSLGWWRRLAQPLTQPYVLSRAWPRDGRWTDALEHDASQVELQRLALGLTRRCRNKIYLGLSELGEQGYEQRGPLLSAIQHVLRHYPLPIEAEHV